MVIRNITGIGGLSVPSSLAGPFFDSGKFYGEKFCRQTIKGLFSLPDKRAINTLAMVGT